MPLDNFVLILVAVLAAAGVTVWVGWLMLYLTLVQLWPEGPIGWIVAVYLCLAVWSWIAPLALRGWWRWRGAA